MSRFVDAHCHLDRYSDPRGVLRAAANAGVVTVAMTETPTGFQKQDLLLRGTPGVRVALGAHPLRAHHITAMELNLFRRLLARAEYVGEVGLDFSPAGASTRQRQSEVFAAILAHPNIAEKVLSVHSRRAERECIERLGNAGANGILHWYSGPLRLIDDAVSAGLYFSVNPAMLRSKNGQRIIDRIPPERVLTETDGPYTKMGSRATEPRDVPWIVERLAERWTIPPAVATTTVFSNMAALFATAAAKKP